MTGGSVSLADGYTPTVNDMMDKYSPNCGGLMQTKTMVGEDFVAPGLSDQLETFYTKARPADKARCLELLTAINIEREIKKAHDAEQRKPVRAQTAGPNSYRNQLNSVPQSVRPMTAMVTGAEELFERARINQQYQTTYKKEFPNLTAVITEAHRPRSTKGCINASHALNGPIGETTYTDAFSGQDNVLSNGNVCWATNEENEKRNNPHPSKEFMVWRFPSNIKIKSKLPDDLTPEIIEQMCRGKSRTTYRDDFMAIPQGFDIRSAIKLPEDWRAKLPYSLASSMRYSYKTPVKFNEIQSNFTRFGCNKKKHEFAIGSVPAVSKPHLHLKPRTTYDREYHDPNQRHLLDIREVSKRMGAQTLERQINLSNPDERETLKAMLRSIKSPSPPSAPPSAPSRNDQSVLRRSPQYSPKYLSTWTGPQ